MLRLRAFKQYCNIISVVLFGAFMKKLSFIGEKREDYDYYSTFPEFRKVMAMQVCFPSEKTTLLLYQDMVGVRLKQNRLEMSDGGEMLSTSFVVILAEKVCKVRLSIVIIAMDSYYFCSSLFIYSY